MTITSSQTAEPHKTTVILIPRAVEKLAQAQGRTGLSKTDLINRAVILYEFIDAEMAAGKEVLVRSEDGSTYAMKFM